MKMRFLVGTAMALLTWASVVSAQAGRTGDETAIRSQFDQFNAAWNKADAKAMGQFFSDDADYISSTGQRGDGRAGIEKILAEQFAGVYKGASIKLTITSIRFLKPDVALANGTFEISGLQSPDGKALPVRKGLSTNVMVKQGDKWLITALRGAVPSPGPRRKTS